MAETQDTVNSIVGLTDKGKYETTLIYPKSGKSEPQYMPPKQYDKTTYYNKVEALLSPNNNLKIQCVKRYV